MGGSLTALAPDFNRAVLGVPGMNYSTLLRRSVDFDHVRAAAVPELPERARAAADPVADPDALGPRRGQRLRAPHDRDPYPNTPPHTVLLHEAFGDHQVANVATEVEARTIGASDARAGARSRAGTATSTPTTASRTIQHVSRSTAPRYVVWDSGSPTPPTTNTPPRAGADPHSHPRSTANARLQKSEFLQLNGKVVDTCGASPATRTATRATASERARPRSRGWRPPSLRCRAAVERGAGHDSVPAALDRARRGQRRTATAAWARRVGGRLARLLPDLGAAGGCRHRHAVPTSTRTPGARPRSFRGRRSGGNGGFNAFFAGASGNGSRSSSAPPRAAVRRQRQPDRHRTSGWAARPTRSRPARPAATDAFSAFFDGASADGGRVFFHTDERLEIDDVDSQADVYQRAGGATTRISTGAAGGNGFSRPSSAAAPRTGPMSSSRPRSRSRRATRTPSWTSMTAPAGPAPSSPPVGRRQRRLRCLLRRQLGGRLTCLLHHRRVAGAQRPRRPVRRLPASWRLDDATLDRAERWQRRGGCSLQGCLRRRHTRILRDRRAAHRAGRFRHERRRLRALAERYREPLDRPGRRQRLLRCCLCRLDARRFTGLHRDGGDPHGGGRRRPDRRLRAIGRLDRAGLDRSGRGQRGLRRELPRDDAERRAESSSRQPNRWRHRTRTLQSTSTSAAAA